MFLPYSWNIFWVCHLDVDLFLLIDLLEFMILYFSLVLGTSQSLSVHLQLCLRISLFPSGTPVRWIAEITLSFIFFSISFTLSIYLCHIRILSYFSNQLHHLNSWQIHLRLTSPSSAHSHRGGFGTTWWRKLPWDFAGRPSPRVMQMTFP